MKTAVPFRRKLPCRWLGVILLMTAILLVVQGYSQIISGNKNILLTGQLTNNVNGAPIPDHDIYILSDSTLNNDFDYFAVVKTDVNGFYYDTIVTTLNDGSLKIYLFGFSNELHEATQYFRFIWNPDYNMFADFQIFDPNAHNDFQANFRAEVDSLYENPLRISFRDMSIGYVIKSWTWEFGDGDGSQIQNPVHEYSAPGIYMITLTISEKKQGDEYFETSTITKQLMVGGTEFHHMGGHVFAGYFPIDYGLAYLYMFDDQNNLIPIDTTLIDTLGYYYFYQLMEGKYITKARLHSSSILYGQFMPTYIGNVYLWNQAQDIELVENNFECDIHLIHSSGVTDGDGMILGQITWDTNKIEPEHVPASDIEIVLLNDHSNCLTCGLSDIEGNFNFGGIAYGTYQIYPDVAGIMTSPMFVTISEEKPVADDVSLVINADEITFSVPENPSEYVENVAYVYPNPVRDQAHIKLNMKKGSTLNLAVYDQLGRMVSRRSIYEEQGEHELVLDASTLPKGLYHVSVIPEDGVQFNNKFIKVE
jgi:PKD repeat protein